MEIVHFVKEIDSSANRETVTKKNQCPPDQFSKGTEKGRELKTSGAGEEDMLVPKLWYYHELMFLRDQCLDQQYQTSVPDINLCRVHYNKERTLTGIFVDMSLV